eukprot:COSAG06_NODE_35280_length_462_cov_0.683196_1_plen_43_part_10
MTDIGCCYGYRYRALVHVMLTEHGACACWMASAYGIRIRDQQV